jgi:cytochrome c oxidase assembly factor CtaG
MMTTSTLLATCWHVDELAVAACVAAPMAYLAAGGARGGVRPVPSASALLVLVLALASPVGQLAEGYLFSAHMLQHLLLVLVVPPLALMGIAPALKGPDGRASRALRFVLRPAVAWGLGVGAMWLWHERTLCDAASQSVLVHRLQELSLLGMGTAFWWPILGPEGAPRLPPLGGVLYLFTACAACTLLGILITFSPVRVCSVFAHPVDRLGVMPLVRDGWGLTPERDQQIGGLLMWVPACLVYGVGIMGLLARLFRDEQPAATREGAP